jgi:hypothetical protein
MKKALHRVTVSAFAQPKATSPSFYKLRNRYAINIVPQSTGDYSS